MTLTSTSLNAGTVAAAGELFGSVSYPEVAVSPIAIYREIEGRE